MKLSSLLLSSAALVIAGSAYAADLPAKKGAPAAKAAPTGCPAFGAGFFQIPGSDNCIKFSGRVTADTTIADPKGSRTASVVGFGAGFRLNTDVRSNTDAGVVRSYARIQGSQGGSMGVKYAYLQIGSFTAGYADSAFITLNNPWGWQASTDDGKVLPVMQYTASLGGSTSMTVAVEDGSARKNTADAGAAQFPDLVGNVKTKFGDNSLQLSAATHNNHGSVSRDVQGYAFQAGATLAASKDTTIYLQGAYANAALSYLGYGSVADYASTDVAATAKGWSTFGAISQVVGAGNLNLTGVYGTLSPASGSDVKISQIELNYDYTGIKGVQIIPSIYYTSSDNGSSSSNSTTGFLRIERDF